MPQSLPLAANVLAGLPHRTDAAEGSIFGFHSGFIPPATPGLSFEFISILAPNFRHNQPDLELSSLEVLASRTAGLVMLLS